MAKKGKTGYLGMFAFIAIILNAIAWIVSLILNATKSSIIIFGQPIQNFFTGIAALLLLIVCLFSAYDFAERQTKGWRILFWVLAIISVLAVVFGLGLPNFVK